MEDIERYCREKSVPFVGRIPFDKQASATINAGHSLASVDCPARDALRDVFKNTIALLGEDSYVEY